MILLYIIGKDSSRAPSGAGGNLQYDCTFKELLLAFDGIWDFIL